MSDIFREIEDELRRENLLKLWSRYSRYIIAGGVVVLVVAGAIVAWRQHLASEHRAQSARYAAALGLARAGKDADAIKMFATVSQESGGYGVLAGFETAALTAKAGDAKAAAAAYDKIAASTDVGPELRDLATLLSVMQTFAQAEPAAVIARLAPLAADGKPWRASALDLTASAQLKAGNKAAALEIYKKLADDLAAPEGVRGRAAEMTAALAE